MTNTWPRKKVLNKEKCSYDVNPKCYTSRKNPHYFIKVFFEQIDHSQDTKPKSVATIICFVVKIWAFWYILSHVLG